MTSPSTAILQATDLRKTFGDFTAVDGITFHLNRGECLGLLGPNGAGKTSTIRMIYGISPPSGGRLELFGLDIRTGWRSIRARLGVCQQENNLDPDLTVLQNLEVFARYFDLPKAVASKKARKLLEFIALEHRSEEVVTTLSGGMMRRLVLARALLNDPEILILDEPTTGLDPQSRHQVWERVEGLRSEGLSVLITTHNMDEASRLCDRLIIMDHGKILIQGRPADLVREHVGRDVLEIIEPGREVQDFVSQNGFQFDSLEHRIIVYGEEGDRLFERVASRYCNENCLYRMATIEDVFLRLTGRDLRE